MTDSPNINPDSWTQKELLKHLYRVSADMRQHIEVIKNSLQKIELNIDEIEKDIIKIETKINTTDDQVNRRIHRTSTLAAVIGTIIAAIALYFSVI